MYNIITKKISPIDVTKSSIYFYIICKVPILYLISSLEVILFLTQSLFKLISKGEWYASTLMT